MISREPTLERLATAQSLLLAPFGLNESHLTRALAQITAHRVDDADLYFQYTRSEGWSLEEGIVKTGSFSIDQGVGVRAVAGEKTAFAYSDDISEASLMDAALTVRSIAASGQNRRVKTPARKVAGSRSLYGGQDPIASLDSTAKVELLGRVEKLARAKDPRVVQVMAGLASEYDVVMVARADGTLAADVRPLVRLSVTVIAEHEGPSRVGSGGGGGRFGLAYFTDDQIAEYVNDAVKAALTNLDARPAPAGEMTVVLGPGWPGVLLHEAIGHGLEGDFNRKGSSAFSGRIGQRVAAKGVTVLDDGTIADRRGSLNVDDEGHASQRNVLIEDGILKGYIQDAMNARLMGVKPTGNGRRESYAHVPMPRMTNTYMLGRRQGPEGDRREHQEGPVCHQLRRRAGGHHLGQVRLQRQRGLLGGERQDPVPGEGRHHRRQRPRVAQESHHDRQRHEARQRRGHLRQGRPERARGRRSTDAAHRRPDRGRHRLRPARKPRVNEPVLHSRLMQTRIAFYFYFWFSVPGGREASA
jgi:TldD protein